MNFTDWITDDIKKVLLVEPNFPIPAKSRNHSNFLPIGLLKIASYLRSKSIEVIVSFKPDIFLKYFLSYFNFFIFLLHNYTKLLYIKNKKMYIVFIRKNYIHFYF